MSDDLSQLIRQAEQAASAGEWFLAEQAWTEVRRRDPRNAKAAFSLGVHAMRRRDFPGAMTFLWEAVQASPRDPFTLLTYAKACREAGDSDREGESLEAVLAIDPYFLPALLDKAARLERLGAVPTAAMFYRNALRIAGLEAGWPPMLKPQLTRARQAFESHAGSFNAYLNEAMGAATSGLPPDKTERWREAASIMAGLTEPYRQSANQLYVPRLPAIPFYDRSMFPWAKDLEAKTDLIRNELLAALKKEQGEFSPYIAVRPGQPVDQWAALNNSNRWSHYSLWRNGQPNDTHLAQCPETRKALEAVDMAEIAGLCPNAMFSALAPHTEIPPHHGETNARLVVHLPLVVPPKCTYRVGFEHREWREGELLIFDDTIEHMARNDSDQLRVVLIFDVWNPLLAREERDVVRSLAAAARTYNAVPERKPG
jgi:aspartyl/asparaginyl beta-hydroxylase (cupin superfamily)